MPTYFDGYLVRRALIEDAEIIACQRAFMFRDMGVLKEEDVEKLQQASTLWFRQRISSAEYIGWLVELDDEIVAGGGIRLQEAGPAPGLYEIGRSGHIENVYTSPSHRRRGIARFVLSIILEWSKAQCLDHVTLVASNAGRPLYEAMGFAATSHMRCDLK